MDHVQLSQDRLDWGVAFFSLLQRVVSKAKLKHYSGVQHTISPFAATVPFFLVLLFVWLVINEDCFCVLFSWFILMCCGVFVIVIRLLS